MAQTIKIKRSTNVASPTTLENAELAYSANSNKLFIGRPGGSTSDVDAIGGKYYTDEIANATSADNAGTIARRSADGEIFATTFSTGSADSDDWTTAVNWGNHALAGYLVSSDISSLSGKVNKAGDSMTGNLSFGDNIAATFGASSDLSISHSTSGSASSVIAETGTGNLVIKGSNIEMRSSTGELYGQFVQDGVSQLYTNDIVSLITTSSGITVKDSSGNQGTVNGKISTLSNHDTDDLGEGSTNKYFTDARVDTRADHLLKHSAHSNITVTDGTGANAGKLIMTAAAQYGDSDVVTKLTNMGITSSGSVGNQVIDLPQLTFSGSTIYAAEVLTLDPSGHDDETGTVRVRGNLTVEGTTTTVNSETVSIADNEILLNSDLTGVAVDGGIKLNRGSSGADAYLNWSETAGAWQVQGNTITHANSTLDGGSF